MTISERIFELLEKRGMSQKEFSEKTGIAQSSISDWKRKKTNGSALMEFLTLDKGRQGRLLGYLKALTEMQQDKS